MKYKEFDKVVIKSSNKIGYVFATYNGVVYAIRDKKHKFIDWYYENDIELFTIDNKPLLEDIIT